MNCHHCNRYLHKDFFCLTRFTICDLYNLETKTSFLDELWMSNLKLLRSVKKSRSAFALKRISLFRFSYLRCRPPRSAYLDKTECRLIRTRHSRSH